MRIALSAALLALALTNVATAAPRKAFDLICRGDQVISDRDNAISYSARLHVDETAQQFCAGSCPRPLSLTMDGDVLTYVTDSRSNWKQGAIAGRYATVQIQLFISAWSGRVIYVEEDRDVCPNCRSSADRLTSIHAVCTRAPFSGFTTSLPPPDHWNGTSQQRWRRQFGR